MTDKRRLRALRESRLKEAIDGVRKDAEKLQYSPGFLDKITIEYELLFGKKAATKVPP